jgi:hypothetical protein
VRPAGACIGTAAWAQLIRSLCLSARLWRQGLWATGHRSASATTGTQGLILMSDTERAFATRSLKVRPEAASPQ